LFTKIRNFRKFVQYPEAAFGHWRVEPTDSLSDLGAVTVQSRNICILTDRTNGRAYATVLRPSVVCTEYVLWLNSAS